LKFQQVLLLAATLTTLWLFLLDVYLMLDLARGGGRWTNAEPAIAEAISFLGMLFLAICPFPILFRPTRWYILRTLGKIVTAPFHMVDFKDFYTGDQLTSLVNVFNDICYSFCHILSGNFLSTTTDVQCTNVQNTAVWCLAFLPYWWRFLQCLRKYRDNPPANQRQLYNAAKYFSSMLTTLFALMWKNFPVNQYLIVWIIAATWSTIFSYSWDIYCDWGLVSFQPGEKWPTFMGRKLLIKNHAWYYLAMGTNFLLRIACEWLEEGKMQRTLKSSEALRVSLLLTDSALLPAHYSLCCLLRGRGVHHLPHPIRD
jgi:hypothetical protein